MKKTITVLMVLSMLCAIVPQAMADSFALNGTVVSVDEVYAVAPIGGTLETVTVRSGGHVSIGDTLATLRTIGVYAKQDGTVRLFGDAGDDAAAVAEQYGGVAYIEPSCLYTISASTKTAYDVEDNRIIHPGEKVWLRCYTDSKHKGTGIVTTVSGTSFTVQVTEGAFVTGEAVNIFRTEEFAAASRIGKGNIAHTDPIAYTAEGSIVKFCVRDGSTVRKGDLLFETLTGTYDGYRMLGNTVCSPVNGIVSELNASENTAIEKGGTVCVIWPDEAMRVRVSASEADLRSLQIGMTVTVSFPYLGADIVSVEGSVESISGFADGESPEEESEEAWYYAYIRFEAPANVRYGMSAIVSSLSAEQ